MSAAIQERLEFAPPPTPGLARAMLLAILAHGVLLIVLTLGVQWKRDATPITVEAELWSSVPQQAAAPAAEETAPPEPPKPLPPKPQPKPEPVVVPKPVPQVDPAIALAREKEKSRLLKEKQLQLEKDKLAQEKKKQEKLAQEKALKEKEQQKTLQAKAAKDKAAKEAAETKKLEEQRQQNIKRMAGLANSGGSGEAGSTGTAARSSGPSAGYAGRIKALMRRNTTYTETIDGNPVAEVEVRTSPDGTIISRKLTKPSGVKSWDEAVLNAIDKTEILPKDVDGRVPSVMVISFRPKD